MAIRTIALITLRPGLVARVLVAQGRPWVEIELHHAVALRVWAQGWPS